MLAAARDERQDVLVLAHGGALDSPAAVEQLYRLTDAQGFVGASSVERIPIEVAVSTAVRDFEAVHSAGRRGGQPVAPAPDIGV